MNTENTIDITLITYNRAEYLRNTLASLLSAESPVRNCAILILDNRSTDATSDVISEFRRTHPNVTHVVNRFNVGGNANIAKAMEHYGAAPYHWILCDDDTYDWRGWPDVEEAMRPDTVMRNAYESTFALFQHLAPVITHINHGGKIYVAKHGIVSPGEYGTDISYTRGYVKSEVFARSRTMTLAVGFANLTLNLKDRRLSKRAFRALVFGPQMGALGFFGEIFFRLRGVDGASAFRDVMNQSPLWAKFILVPLRLIQNSPLYHILTSKWLYTKARQVTDWINARARKRLKA